MSDPSSNGWRLSSEQLQFLEELLGDAILERAEEKFRAALEADREVLKDLLLDELVELHDGNGNGSEAAPSVDEEALVDRVEARVQDALEDRARTVADTLRAELADRMEGSGPAELPDGLVVADDLRTLEEWVRGRLDDLASNGNANGDGAESADAVVIQRSRRTAPWSLVLGGVALFVVIMVAGWIGLASRLEWALDRREDRLAALSQEAESTVKQLRERATTSDELFREIGAAASDVRRLSGSAALTRELSTALKNDPGFVAATTGPRGAVGPVGTPKRVGVAPGRFSFQNTAGATVAVVGQDETGRGHARIFGESGATVAYLGTDNGTEGTVRVRDTGGASEIAVRAGKDSSSVAISTVRGQQAFIRTRNGLSAEMGVSNASGDGGVMLRSRGGMGSISVNGMSVHDFAEVFELVSRQGVAPGTVMSVAGPGGRLGPSTWAYDPTVIGVVSGAGGLQPGLTIGSRADGSQDLPVAMSGQVYVRVNGAGGPIQVGDLLVASHVPGVAMRATDLSRTPGAVVGKAMESLSEFPSGENLVRMFVMAR